MLAMVNQTDTETERLTGIQQEIQALNDANKPLHAQQTEQAMKMIALVEEAWGIKLRAMFPETPIVKDTCLAEIKPTDNLNTADKLTEAVQKMGVILTRIEHDTTRNTYRLYGASAT